MDRKIKRCAKCNIPKYYHRFQLLSGDIGDVCDVCRLPTPRIQVCKKMKRLSSGRQPIAHDPWEIHINPLHEEHKMEKQIKVGAPDFIIADEKYYSRGALATALKKSEQTLAGWGVRGYGPPFITIGRKPLYPENGLKRWIKSQMVK